MILDVAQDLKVHSLRLVHLTVLLLISTDSRFLIRPQRYQLLRADRGRGGHCDGRAEIIDEPA